ncbi:MAG: hypothetical protein U0791_09045 [Gemmataceae bacterium]
MFALELLFEGGDFLVLGVVGGGLGAGGLEGGDALLEENLLPLVELRDGDAGLGADLGDGLAFEQVFSQDRDLGGGREMPSFGRAHDGHSRVECRHLSRARQFPSSAEAEHEFGKKCVQLSGWSDECRHGPSPSMDSTSTNKASPAIA